MDFTPILLVVLGFAMFAVLAIGFGVDSRGLTTEGEHRPWL